MGLLIVETQHGTQVVRHCCAHSAQAGVQCGMTLAHARALLESAECRVEQFNPNRDEAALRRLAELMMRFSPLVAPDPPDGLLLDITGCQQAFGGEAQLVRRLMRDIADMRFAVRIAAASTYGCAWAFARFAEHSLSLVPSGDMRQALNSLPIKGLRLDDQTIEALHEVNIDRIGQLCNLPRHELAARFDPSLLLRLDQAIGKVLETINPVRPRKHLHAQREFDGPTTQYEAIAITARELLDELCAALLRRERGLRKLTLELMRIDTNPVWTTITLSQPSRNAKHLWSLLQPRIESLNLGFGVEAVRVTATVTARIAHVQRTHSEYGEKVSDSAIGELLDTLMARFGSDRVMRAELVESYLPELAFRLRSVMERTGDLPAAVIAHYAAPLPAQHPSVRPTRLLPQPIRIEVETISDRPCVWVWQGIRQRIIESIGPERIWLPWWAGSKSPLLGRDYHAVQDESGRWLWLYRFTMTGQWFLHGEWT